MEELKQSVCACAASSAVCMHMSINTFKYSAEQLWILAYHLQGTRPDLSTLWQISQQRSFYSYLMTTWIPFQYLHDNITYFHSNYVYRDQYNNMGFVMFTCKYLHTFMDRSWQSEVIKKT